jgi:hypothetical protein
VVLAWLMGGAFTLALLATPLFLRSDGQPPPSAVLITTRTLFIAMVALLLVAVVWLGPIFSRRGRLEYEAARARQLEVLNERSHVPLEESSRLQLLNSFLEDVQDANFDAAFQRFEEFHQNARREAIMSQVFFAFLSAVMGTAFGFLIALL